MHEEDNQIIDEEELQDDVALEPFQEAMNEMEPSDLLDDSMPEPQPLTQENNFRNSILQRLYSDDSTSSRIKDVINGQKNTLNRPHLPNPNGEDNQGSENGKGAAGQAMDAVAGAADKAADKVAATAISAVSHGAVSPQAAEGLVKVAKKIMPKTIPQKILEFLGFFPESITNNPILSKIVLSGLVGILGFFLIIVVLTGGSGRGTEEKNELAYYLAYGIVSDGETNATLAEYLKYTGWCDDEDTCKDTTAYKFYSLFRDTIIIKSREYAELNEETNRSSGENRCEENLSIRINDNVTSRLLGAILYGRAEDELLSEEEGSEKLGQYMAEMDYLVNSIFQEESFSSANEYVCYALGNIDYFKEQIIKNGGYIDQYRADLGTGLPYDDKIEIYEAMLSEADRYIGKTSDDTLGTYIECSGITVVDEEGNVVGTYALEEYVAGVVTGEMYEDFPIESKKALAVAARTYVLASTDSCKNSIESSSNRQNFNSNISDSAREATNATAGQILVDSDGNIFSTEYDSWNCKGSTTCTYTKKPNGETHTVTISDTYLSRAAGGHGRGMSQIAAADMANQGSDYKSILLYFYSDGVQLSNLTSSSTGITGQKYTSTAVIHNNSTDLYNSSFYNKNASNLGQCVWYARSRAQEILFYSNMPTDLKNVAINSIKTTYGNGEAWFKNPDGNIFAKSTDVTQPRAGAIVSWSGGVDECTPNCGHVAIVEAVNPDGTVVISEGWKKGSWDSMSWSSVGYQTKTVTLDYIKYHTNRSGDQYYFNGYVYLLG